MNAVTRAQLTFHMFTSLQIYPGHIFNDGQLIYVSKNVKPLFTKQ